MPFDHVTAEAAQPPQVGPRSVDGDGSGGAGVQSLRATTPASLLRLQRLAGNAAVQRAVGIEELQVTPSVATEGGATETATTAAPSEANAAAPAAAPSTATLGDGSGPATINGSSLDVNAPVVNLHAGMVTADGVLRASTIIADTVVAASYTPGAGNIM